MVCLFNRFLVEDLWAPETQPVFTFAAHPRIQVLIFDDSPCYMAVFCIDGLPRLKEQLIENLNEYYHKTTTDRNFHAFLLELVV